jgi:hypothetical protein
MITELKLQILAADFNNPNNYANKLICPIGRALQRIGYNINFFHVDYIDIGNSMVRIDALDQKIREMFAFLYPNRRWESKDNIIGKNDDINFTPTEPVDFEYIIKVN